MIPDVEELLPTDIAAGKRKLHARKHVAIRRDVAGSVTGTTRKTVQGVFARCRRRSAEFFHVAHQFLVMEDLLEVRTGNSQGEDGCVSVHFWRDGGVKRLSNSYLFRQRDHAGLVGEIALAKDLGVVYTLDP